MAQTRQYVEQRYFESAQYYWKKAQRNRIFYQWTRYLTIILGSLVTLFATLSQQKFGSSAMGVMVAVTTPALAALLTVIGGLTQSFQWGATWRDMVLTAQALERELDRIKSTEDSALNLVQELDRLNNMVIEETKGFFERVVGRADSNTEERILRPT